MSQVSHPVSGRSRDQPSNRPPQSDEGPPHQSHQQRQQSRHYIGTAGASSSPGGRRVSAASFSGGSDARARNTMAGERGNSFSSLPPMDDLYGRHSHAGMMGMGMGMDESGSGLSSSAEMDYYGASAAAAAAARRHEPLDPTTAVLDAAILDLTRRRLAMHPSSAPPGAAGGGGGGAEPPGALNVGRDREANKWELSSRASYTTSASLAARQQHLHQQQKELEYRQRELEVQRQQLMAGMQEHAKSTSLLAAQQQSSSSGMGGGGGGGGVPSSQQQWWVCQVCHTKAFASHDEAMHHELMCCPEPHSYDAAMSAMTIPSDSAMVLPPLGGGGIPGYPVVSPSLDLDSSRAGPFALLKEPIPLAMSSDKDWLTPLHCFVRRQCVQVFTATQSDVSTPSKGKRKPIHVGQIGIRCPHCHSTDSSKPRERGSVYYPTSISSIYNATMNLLQRHLHNCSSVPADIMRRYETLKSDDARSGTSKRYWIESSMSLGLVDTSSGIRYSALTPPPLPGLTSQQHATGSFSVERRNSNDFFSCNSNAVADLKDDETSATDDAGSASPAPLDPPDSAVPPTSPTGSPPRSPPRADEGDDDGSNAAARDNTEQTLMDSAILVMPEDEPYSTKFSFHLISQMQPCVFTEADRLGKRKGLPPGFPGLACRHCFGGYGSGRFFPSSIKTLSDTSKTLNVLHNHMMRCRKCPNDTRETLDKLRASHDEERSKMKFGSQKAFFAKVWGRLHKNGTPKAPKKKRKSVSSQPQQEYTPLPPMGASMSASMSASMMPFMDTRYFGPPITPPPNSGTGWMHDSFSTLDALGSPLEVPDSKRRRSMN